MVVDLCLSAAGRQTVEQHHIFILEQSPDFIHGLCVVPALSWTRLDLNVVAHAVEAVFITRRSMRNIPLSTRALSTPGVTPGTSRSSVRDTSCSGAACRIHPDLSRYDTKGVLPLAGAFYPVEERMKFSLSPLSASRTTKKSVSSAGIFDYSLIDFHNSGLQQLTHRSGGVG